jgi:hypothetical protein
MSDSETGVKHKPLATVSAPVESLRRAFDALADCADEVYATVTTDGINTAAVDAANVQATSVEIGAETSVNSSTDVTLDVETLATVLGAAKDDAATLRLYDERVELSAGRAEFEAPQPNPSAVRRRPDTDFSAVNEWATVECDAMDLHSGVHYATVLDDNMRVRAQPGGAVTLAADGREGETEHRLAGVVGADAAVETLLSQGYLSNLLDTIEGLHSRTKVRVGDEGPLVVEWDDDGLSYKWALAPRVEVS